MAAVTSAVRDPFLTPILETAATVRSQALTVFDLLDEVEEDEQETSSGEPDSEAATHRGMLLSNVSTLRRQNRHLAQTTRQTKANTAGSRGGVDRLYLSLQNLYYEQKHLRGEIRACEEFPHSYSRLPLISEDEFLEKMPEWRERRDLADAPAQENEDEEAKEDDLEFGEEGLMRARIRHEKEERKALEAQRNALVKRKMELVKENAKRKEDLSKLDKELEAFVEAAQKIQKTFDKET